MERLVDPGFTRGAQLARVLGVTAMRLASAGVLPFRYSYYATRIRVVPRTPPRAGPSTTTGAGRWRWRPTRSQTLASTLVTRAEDMERRLDAMLAAGRLPRQEAADQRSADATGADAAGSR